ncbi:hypothetical protein [Austwickia sp. TVS 96-490-7B]|uniref:hypothetical protein n=1 Tax=Austwickia sp. TVS 96-490-7B TaxID=2830843 RepID=UPI001C591CC2|nr:hypothetical protein [Austwickia sp. TVS 96-490-7B]
MNTGPLLDHAHTGPLLHRAHPDPLLDQLIWRQGVASRADLVVSNRALRRAVADGRICHLARGRYALPSVARARAEAHRRSAVLSHLSAAVDHGWGVGQAPRRISVMVPRGRKVRRTDMGSLDIHYGLLTRGEIARGRTDPLRTVVDCARTLPWSEVLAVADSALRAGDVGAEELQRAGVRCRGRGAGQVRRVAESASAAAANPFESGARALGLEVPLLDLRPQVWIEVGSLRARVDLADLRLGLVVECDGYEFHGGSAGFVRDRRRYTQLTAADWVVFSLVWADVFVTAEQTRRCLAGWVERQPRTPRRRPGVWDRTWSVPSDVQCYPGVSGPQWRSAM